VYPKKKVTYCKKCKSHATFKLFEYKPGTPRLLAQGKRRYDRKQAGYGGQTKPIFRKKVKLTKKLVIRLCCDACKTQIMYSGKRCKKFEILLSR